VQAISLIGVLFVKFALEHVAEQLVDAICLVVFVDAGDQHVALAQLSEPVPGVGNSSDTLGQPRFQCVEDRTTSQ
jgi:hypothetical protein